MRHLLAILLFLYMGVLVSLRAVGRFPAPGPADLAGRIGDPLVRVEGTVSDFPIIRWNQTRFVLQGCAVDSPHCGLAQVTLQFAWPELGYGDHVRLRGWPHRPRPPTRNRPFDEAGYLASKGIYTHLKGWSSAALEWHRPAGPWSLSGCIAEARARFCRFWTERLPEPEASLLIGLTIGGKGILDSATKETCIRAGVYHLVVVSGQNVALLISLGFWLLSTAGFPTRWTLLVALPVMLFYAQLSGAEPPVLRAVAMAVYSLAAFLLRRDPPPLQGLWAGALALLALWPESLFGASFQLSFTATWALMLAWPWVEEQTRRWPQPGRWAAQAVLVSAAIQIGMAPPLAFYFHRLSLSGFAAPIVIFPVAGAAMVAGLALGAIGAVAPAVVPSFAIAGVEKGMTLLWQLIDGLAAWPGAVVEVAAPSRLRLGLYYGALCSILFVIHRRRNHVHPALQLHRDRF